MIEPDIYVGAPPVGDLTLPSAEPTDRFLYAPRGVYFDDDVLVVTDSGNHRVLIWHGVPEADGRPADVVLGQPDFFSEGPRAGGDDVVRGMHLPTGVAVIAGRLIVADAWHHRLLVWDAVPQTSFAPPDHVLGQPSPEAVTPNRGGEITARGMYWPYGFGLVGGIFYVTDTGNRRILGWRGLPEPEQPADFVMGQDAPSDGYENRGRAVGPDTYRWPHDVAGDDDVLFIADAGNHRVLGWAPPPERDAPARLVLGQEDFATAFEMPHTPPGPSRMRFPYAVSLCGNRLAVADTANNRVLVWHEAPREGAFHPADEVLGQADFSTAGENRWTAVTKETLCWPYGLHQHGNRIAVADSGNNRVVIWKVEEPAKAQAGRAALTP